ncbi:MAG: hypothetical protein JSR41_00335 [Proteobacteria bacterium]|nr:hypothetical protein [Pseudomonadota bacterium]
MNALRPSLPWQRLAAALAAGAAVLLTTGCAGGGSTSGSTSAGTGGSSVEVFGVIDAGVSRSTSKSDRR